MSHLLDRPVSDFPGESYVVRGAEPSARFLAKVNELRSRKDTAPVFMLGEPIVDNLFISAAAKTFATRVRMDAPVETTRGVFSTDRWNQNFRLDLVNTLNEIAPPNVDEMGRTYGNGVRSNWNGLLHAAGYGMHPTTIPVYDNTKRRSDAGLASEFVEPWHRVLFQALVRVLFDPMSMEPVKLAQREGSSSCIPDMTTDSHHKAQIARMGMKSAHAAGALMLKGDYEKAWELYKHGGAYIVVFRLQASDKVVIKFEDGRTIYSFRDRMVADIEYALTGGRSGKLIPASKDLSNLGFFANHIGAMRMRVASGAPGTTGYSIMPFAQSVRKSMYKRFDFAFKATTRDDKYMKIRGWERELCADVSDHDQNWPTWFIDHMCDELLDMGYAETFIALLRASFKLPYYVGSPSRDEGRILIGDPFAPDGKFGLTSGHPMTDICGTLCMTFVYALVQIEHAAPWLKQNFSKLGMPSLRCVTSYLEGKLDIGVMDKADDAVLLFKGPAVAGASALHQALVDADAKDEVFHTNPYMIVSYEKGGKYLGDIILHSDLRTLQSTRVVGDITSMMINFHSPEYSVNSQAKSRFGQKRPYPGMGLAARAQVYGSSPLFSEVLAVEDFMWKKHSGESFKSYAAALIRHDTELMYSDLTQRSSYMATKLKKIGIFDLSVLELQALAHPEYLYYKINKEDIREEIFDVLFNGLDLDEVEPFFKTLHPSFAR